MKHAPISVVAVVVGSVLRVSLASINLQANDVHYDVIEAMAFENRIPARNEAWQAFQPKLYHATVAALWKTIPDQPLAVRLRVAQLISCAAGVVTLLVVARFLRELDLPAKVRLLAVALVALNPKLIGINAQATNDSFAILFVTLTLYYGWWFFDRPSGRSFVLVLLFAVLAGLSKGHGLVIFPTLLLTFGAATVRSDWSLTQSPSRFGRYGAVFVVVFLTVVPSLGPYWGHYRKYGSPFVTNMPRYGLPHVFERDAVQRPGVVSVADSLLTFRFVDMLVHPVITNATSDGWYPRHRTSLWSQLYGRAHFVHFDAWPPSWESRTPFVLNLGRAILVLALLPTGILLAAIGRRLVAGVRRLMSRTGESKVVLRDWFFDLAALGYLGFVVLYACRYRDFGVMKAIYLFPGLLAYVTLFARECARFYTWCGHHPRICIAADVAFVGLLGLYVVDVMVLIRQLA